MSKAEQKEIRLEVELPHDGFRKAMFFNRFRVDKEPGFLLVQFGLVVASDLMDSYSCILPEEALKSNQDSLIQYLNRMGRTEKSNPMPWKGMSPSPQTDVADVIAMAWRNQLAETCLYAFSLAAATRFSRALGSERTFTAQPLVLLRSTLDAQKQLITALYEE
jgi:hypothetical protein